MIKYVSVMKEKGTDDVTAKQNQQKHMFLHNCRNKSKKMMA